MNWQNSGNRDLIVALQETIAHLRKSESSIWAGRSVEEIVQDLESELAKAQTSRRLDTDLLKSLFAPTGAIQDTSIDNGWGDEFLRISQIIDQFTGSVSKDI